MAIQDALTISAKRRIHGKSGSREGVRQRESPQPWTQVPAHFDARAHDKVRAIPKSFRLPAFLSHAPRPVRGRAQVASAKMCGLLSLALALTTGCKRSLSTAEGSPGPGAAAKGSAPAGPDELMSAATLLAAYNENAARADAMLKGKRIRVWGKAIDVARGGAGALSVTLGADAKGAGARILCLFSESESNEGAALGTGADVTVDGTWTGPGPNVMLKGCSVPHCAMPVCEALRARGVVDDCKVAMKDWSDSANFRVPSAVTPTGFGGGYVECEPNDKVYYFMVNDLRTHARPNQLVLASPKARVVVSMASDNPIPPDVEAKTRALVEAL
jgi:putative nucleic acid binding protein